MMDFSKAPRWRDLVREVEALTPGPLRTGSELKTTFDIMGAAEDRHFRGLGARALAGSASGTPQKVTGVFEYNLEPDEGGTRVSFSCRIEPHGYMWLLRPWLLRSNRTRYTPQLPNLKQEVEREPA